MDREVVNGGTLYVVATPLGNLSDLTPRAARILAAVDVVAAEDTRRARILLGVSGGHPRLLSLHAHSPPARTRQVIALLAGGKSVALVTDAGTPSVSDPGADLVRQAREAGCTVTVIPGPSAVAAALSVSGLPADRYIFLGFIPRRGRERRRLLDQVAASDLTAVIFEAPTRLARLLDDLTARCGSERRVAVARELTKIHEDVRTGTLAELSGYYRDGPVRGEITVVVAGAAAGAGATDATAPVIHLEDRARALLGQGVTRRDAAGRIAKEYGLPRNEAYRRVNAL
jgi:16S rRNA (cytidine1402-2'-O)-methyltransferase